MTKIEQMTHLEERYKTLDSDLDHMCWKSEVGLEVDMEDWYRTIGKMESIQKELAIWKRMPAEYLNAIDRADALITDLQGTLDMCKPIDDDEYDEYQEWQDMTAELRRGEG
jgi:hypothetical protein